MENDLKGALKPMNLAVFQFTALCFYAMEREEKLLKVSKKAVTEPST